MIFMLLAVGLVLVFVIGALAWKSMRGRANRT